MNAITDTLKKNGAKVAYGSWKGTYSSEEFIKAVKEMEKENANVNYSTLEKRNRYSKRCSRNFKRWRTYLNYPYQVISLFFYSYFD